MNAHSECLLWDHQNRSTNRLNHAFKWLDINARRDCCKYTSNIEFRLTVALNEATEKHWNKMKTFQPAYSTHGFYRIFTRNWCSNNNYYYNLWLYIPARWLPVIDQKELHLFIECWHLTDVPNWTWKRSFSLKIPVDSRSVFFFHFSMWLHMNSYQLSD